MTVGLHGLDRRPVTQAGDTLRRAGHMEFGD